MGIGIRVEFTMYESHITVTNLTDDKFKSICGQIGVKPVIIENDTGSGLRQLMTAKFHKTDKLEIAKEEMESIADVFDGHILRRKLEKIVSPQSKLPEHLYLEFHLKYRVDKKEVDGFISKVGSLGGHTSSNALKQADGNDVYVFATVRTQKDFDKMKKVLPYRLVNVIRECVLYDDNMGLDANWGGCGECGLKVLEAFE